MQIQFIDPPNIANLYPLTLTRPAADLRCGIFTLAEKWCKHLQAVDFGFECAEYLQEKFVKIENPSVKIQGNVLPNAELIQAIVENKSVIYKGEKIIEIANEHGTILASESIQLIERPHHIFSFNAEEIQNDFNLLDSKMNKGLNAGNQHFGEHPIFIEEGAKVNFSILNASEGPIYIGKNAQIMEGSMLRGPIAIGEGSVLKMGTKMYGGTTLGPFCTAGGEISNAVFWGFSNKGHDGFLGNAVLGEWCNIGADTNCSNLKNNYEIVKTWNYATNRFDRTGLQFCGLIMGDHSKCGINTMFNTGTVVGVSANIFGAGFPRQFVPDFAWGGATGFSTYDLETAHKTASLVLPRRKKEYTGTEKRILESVFHMTSQHRVWENKL